MFYVFNKSTLCYELFVWQIVKKENRKMKKSPLEKISQKGKGFDIYSFILGLIQHYNGKSYWRMREEAE